MNRGTIQKRRNRIEKTCSHYNIPFLKMLGERFLLLFFRVSAMYYTDSGPTMTHRYDPKDRSNGTEVGVTRTGDRILVGSLVTPRSCVR